MNRLSRGWSFVKGSLAAQVGIAGGGLGIMAVGLTGYRYKESDFHREYTDDAIELLKKNYLIRQYFILSTGTSRSTRGPLLFPSKLESSSPSAEGAVSERQQKQGKGRDEEMGRREAREASEAKGVSEVSEVSEVKGVCEVKGATEVSEALRGDFVVRRMTFKGRKWRAKNMAWCEFTIVPVHNDPLPTRAMKYVWSVMTLSRGKTPYIKVYVTATKGGKVEENDSKVERGIVSNFFRTVTAPARELWEMISLRSARKGPWLLDSVVCVFDSHTHTPSSSLDSLWEWIAQRDESPPPDDSPPLTLRRHEGAAVLLSPSPLQSPPLSLLHPLTYTPQPPLTQEQLSQLNAKKAKSKRESRSVSARTPFDKSELVTLDEMQREGGGVVGGGDGAPVLMGGGGVTPMVLYGHPRSHPALSAQSLACVERSAFFPHRDEYWWRVARWLLLGSVAVGLCRWPSYNYRRNRRKYKEAIEAVQRKPGRRHTVMWDSHSGKFIPR